MCCKPTTQKWCFAIITGYSQGPPSPLAVQGLLSPLICPDITLPEQNTEKSIRFIGLNPSTSTTQT
ncbi:hypothetical protein PICMEDRAFT_17071 [Pichia membranifaciens NRRL Y-2026]|uniref:Uncharacterized protein n=1 Tax=Pichia membranifaciens NRRL Y-2026 TaxID=763406 RepID=A0A1E3NI41_9ASCO|nr:hypothetical protein PICMEDRAFT_17071 [Pichia membranifaciens NRRL Y-2026]ODQ45802.1 hypothetical protein PICMEDRAFT_17071 [Pichia membranifaciens NRRL Y-2026]